MVFFYYVCVFNSTTMDKQDKDRADRVIQIYQESGMNQRQFSDVIGVSQQLISAIINYSKKPNESVLFGIIDNIDSVDPLWLITGKKMKTVIEHNVPLSSEKTNPISFYLKDIVKERINKLADNILKERLSEIILNKISTLENLTGENNEKAPEI